MNEQLSAKFGGIKVWVKYGGEHAEGAIIVSQLDEPVHYCPAAAMTASAAAFLDVLSPASALTADTRGAVAGGAAEYLYRWAPMIGIYGGTIDVFRNMIAQHVLGLGRPNFSPPKKES